MASPKKWYNPALHWPFKKKVKTRLQLTLEDLEKQAAELLGDPHDDIAITVFRRLRLRQFQLEKGQEEALSLEKQRKTFGHSDSTSTDLKSVSDYGEIGHFPFFRDEEFTDELPIDRLCAALKRDGVPSHLSNIATLNGQLAQFTFYEALCGAQSKPPSKTLQAAADAYRVYPGMDGLVRLNRAALYEFYPKETPQRPEHFASSSTLRAYRLAVTDLFVEKALAFLEEHALPYRHWGLAANISASIVILIGVVLSVVLSVAQIPGFLQFLPWVASKAQDASNASWPGLALNVTRAFTAYGFIVLLSVGLWRFGKVMLDQSERLMERRHALRQGRLFVHLNDGKLSLEEMVQAFNWNVSQSNAFANMKTEAQAPMGAVVTTATTAAAEVAKAGVQAFAKKKE